MIRMFKHRDETEVSKILRKFIEDDVFLGFFVCISTVCIKWVSRKGKQLSINKYTNVGKRCLNFNREANYRPQCAFDDSAEEGIAVVMFAYLSIFSLGFLLLFIVHYSYPIELSFLAYPTKLEEKSRWRCRLISKFPRLSFLTKKRKNKKKEKNDQTGTQATIQTTFAYYNVLRIKFPKNDF